jgi:hypothetical protein
MNKKGSLGVVMAIILVIASIMVIYGISAKFFKLADDSLQDSICSANILGANGIIQNGADGISDSIGDFGEREGGAAGGVIGRTAGWGASKGLEAGARKSLKNPLCATKVEIYDADEFKGLPGNNDSEKVGLVLGKMINKCWNTFGQGKIKNVFGQDKTTILEKIFLEKSDLGNYFFTCYKVKFEMDDPSDSVKVIDFMNTGTGALWTHNVKGKPITDVYTQESFNVQTKKYWASSSKDDLPYAGAVLWDGFGYLEFSENLTGVYKKDFDEVITDSARLGAGSAAAMAILAAATINFWNPVGWTLAAVGTIVSATAAVGASGVVVGGVFSTSYTMDLLPGQGEKLTDIYSDEFYEIRFYSPYMEDEEITFNMNSIKIVPSDGDHDLTSTEVEGVIHN